MIETEKIGHFIKPHGLKGQVSLFLTTSKNIDFNQVKLVFIEINNVPTPFFIEKITQATDKVIVKLENVNSEEEIKKLLKKDVSISKEYILNDEETENNLIGFNLIEKSTGALGKITDIQDFPQHPVLFLIYKNKEVLLPYIDDFIEKIDMESKTIYYNAPEGLLDIYLIP